MLCKYCGLQADSVNHGSPEACIVALEEELARLRRLLDSANVGVFASEPSRAANDSSRRDRAEHRQRVRRPPHP